MLIQALITVVLAIPAISFFFDRFVTPAYQLDFTKQQKEYIEEQIELINRNESLQDNLDKTQALQERTKIQLSETQGKLVDVQKN